MANNGHSSGNSSPPAEIPASPGEMAAVNPAALTVEQLAKMLALPEEKVRDHVAAGAPVAADGTINLIHYAAWLNKQLRSAEGESLHESLHDSFAVVNDPRSGTRRGEELDGD